MSFWSSNKWLWNSVPYINFSCVHWPRSWSLDLAFSAGNPFSWKSARPRLSTFPIWQRVVKEFLNVLFLGAYRSPIVGWCWGYPDSLTDSLTDSQGTLRWEPTRSAIGGKFITGHCLRMNWEEDTRGTKENTQMHPRCTTLLNRARDGSLMMPCHAILVHNLVCFDICQVKHGPYKQTC